MTAEHLRDGQLVSIVFHAMACGQLACFGVVPRCDVMALAIPEHEPVELGFRHHFIPSSMNGSLANKPASDGDGATGANPAS